MSPDVSEAAPPLASRFRLILPPCRSFAAAAVAVSVAGVAAADEPAIAAVAVEAEGAGAAAVLAAPLQWTCRRHDRYLRQMR